MEETGRIIHAMPMRTGTSKSTGKEWSSREYVLEIHGERRTRHMVFEVFGEDRLREFNLHKDDLVTVKFDIDAREWKDRWFNVIRAYAVARQHQPASQEAPLPYPPPQDDNSQLHF